MSQLKEDIIDIIRGEGYDTITACEMAHAFVERVKDITAPTTYHIGRTSFTLTPKRKVPA